MTMPQVYFGDVCIGAPLPELIKRPTRTMLFRFSAVTWNAHRIHYDEAYARTEGHPDVLVQATMHGAFLLEMATAFAGPAGRVGALTYSNRGKAFPGDVLTSGGTVTGLDPVKRAVDCEIWERRQDGGLCANGTARIFLPNRP
jgi:hydroxyacyl-ACP dehydratase HTD2-like protein with hotdog domain